MNEKPIQASLPSRILCTDPASQQFVSALHEAIKLHGFANIRITAVTSEIDRATLAVVGKDPKGMPLYGVGPSTQATLNITMLVDSASTHTIPAPPQKDAAVNAGGNKWIQLHSHASNLTFFDAKTETEWLANWAKDVACGPCRDEWTKTMAEAPPDLTSSEAYFVWTVRAHNRINKILNRPAWTVDRARAEYVKSSESVSPIGVPV